MSEKKKRKKKVKTKLKSRSKLLVMEARTRSYAVIAPAFISDVLHSSHKLMRYVIRDM